LRALDERRADYDDDVLLPEPFGAGQETRLVSAGRYWAFDLRWALLSARERSPTEDRFVEQGSG
jgi:hypothetical protein